MPDLACKSPFAVALIIAGSLIVITLTFFILNRALATYKITFSYLFFSFWLHILFGFFIDGVTCFVGNNTEHIGLIFMVAFLVIILFSIVFLQFWFCDLAFPAKKSSKNCSFFNFISQGPILTRKEFEIVLSRIQGAPPIFAVEGLKIGYLTGTTKKKILPFIEEIEYGSWVDSGSFVQDSKKSLSVVRVRVVSDFSPELKDKSDSQGKNIEVNDSKFKYKQPSVYIENVPEYFLICEGEIPFVYSLYHFILFRILLMILSLTGALLIFHAIFSFFVGKTVVTIKKKVSHDSSLKNKGKTNDDSVVLSGSTELMDKFDRIVEKNKTKKNKLLFPALLKIPGLYCNYSDEHCETLIEPIRFTKKLRSGDDSKT